MNIGVGRPRKLIVHPQQQHEPIQVVAQADNSSQDSQ